MKRSFDLILTLVTVPLWLPLIALVALLVRIRLGSPVFFCQLRPGLHGKPFRMVKFRSMISPAGSADEQLSDEERMTGFGRRLRSMSLDEIPEIWNVLRGEMSWVGPRPLLVEYLPLYSREQARRHEVRPGITGWAQVNGRNALSWEEKFVLDVWYVDHQSIWLDIKILAMTMYSVICRKGVSEAGQATMSRFVGTPRSGSSHE